MSWKKGESSSIEKPLEFDEVSSSSTIYLRKNIQKVTRTDEMSGATYSVWEYDEQQIPKEDWSRYQELMQAKEDISNTDDGVFDLAMIVSEHAEKLAELEVAATSAR